MCNIIVWIDDVNMKNLRIHIIILISKVQRPGIVCSWWSDFCSINYSSMATVTWYWISEWIDYGKSSEVGLFQAAVWVTSWMHKVDLNCGWIWSIRRFIAQICVVDLSLTNILFVWNSIIKVNHTFGSVSTSIWHSCRIYYIRYIRQNNQVGHLLELVVGSIGLVLRSILNWDDWSFPEMNIVVLHMGSQGNVGSVVLSVVNALAKITNHVRNNLAPGSRGEVEINSIQLRQTSSLYRSFQMISK